VRRSVYNIEIMEKVLRSYIPKVLTVEIKLNC